MARVQLECFVAPPHQDPCHVQASISYLQVGHLKSKAKGYTSVSCGCSVAVRCCSSTPLPMISSLPSQPSPWRMSPSSAPWAVERFQGLWTAKVSASFCAAMALVMTYAQALSALVLRLLGKAQLNLQNLCSKNRTLGLCGGEDVLMADNLRGLKDGLLEQGGLGMALLSTTAMAKDHISPVLATLCANPTFMSGLVAWAVAQVLKVFTTFFVERRWDFKMLLGSGGMPSSHSALCVALTTSVAICHGISDALFPVCLGFSLIVMYDATGVRRHAGMQAEVLNLIVEDLFQGHPISEKKLKELLGHTPLQVGGGAILGMVVGYLCSQGYSAFSTGHGF